MNETKRSIADELRDVLPNRETVIDVVNGFGNNGKPTKAITFGHRDLQPEPVQEAEIERAGARCHQFHSIDAFIEYLIRECHPDKSLILADTKNVCINASIDESRLLDRENVMFVATPHPLFAPWKTLIDRPINVIDFALFVMKYRSVVIEPDGRDLALLFSQIKMSKSITKKVGIGPKTLNGVMVETLIGSEKHSVEVELPESVTINAPLYIDTDPIEITFDLLVTEMNGELVVLVTAPLIEELAITAFSQFVTKVRKGTALLTGFGRVQERDWKTVR